MVPVFRNRFNIRVTNIIRNRSQLIKSDILVVGTMLDKKIFKTGTISWSFEIMLWLSIKMILFIISFERAVFIKSR